MPLKHATQDAAATLIEAAKGFYQKGWMLGTSGNLSIRLSAPEEPLHFLISASGKDKGNLQPTDFVEVGLDNPSQAASAKGNGDKKSSAETLLHGAIYQKVPTAGAVYHVHTVNAAILSLHGMTQPGLIQFSGLEMIKGLGLDSHDVSIQLPVLENSQDMLELSQLVPHRIQPEVPGLLLQGHGLYTWGSTPFEAKRHVEIWEYLFQFRVTEMTLAPALANSDAKRFRNAIH